MPFAAEANVFGKCFDESNNLLAVRFMMQLRGAKFPQ